MSLLAIKSHMMQVKMASLSSLCLLFGTEQESMRCLLRHWIQKGKIRECERKNNCGKCSKCPLAATELYEWIDNNPSNKLLQPLICI